MGGYFGAFIIGGTVAAIELVTRYKDDFRRSLTSLPAIFYVLLNAGVALGAALWVVDFYPEAVSRGTPSGPAVNPALLAVVAGFGSLAVLRAGVMRIRIGRSDEVTVGPGLVIEKLLAVVDRAVDRRMASFRGAVADRLTPKVDFASHGTALVTECITRLSNIGADESQQLREVVNALTGRNDIDARQKTRSLIMTLLSVVGEKVLDESVQSVTA